MNIKRSYKKRKIIYTLLTLLVIGGVIVVYFLFFYPKHTSDDQGIDYSAPSQDQVDAGLEAKRKAVENDQQSKNDGEASFTVNITSASIHPKELRVRTAINGIFGSGSCELTLSKGDKVVRKSSGTQSLPQMSTCKGFDVPVSELSPGTWEINLSVTINGEVARTTTSVEV